MNLLFASLFIVVYCYISNKFCNKKKLQFLKNFQWIIIIFVYFCAPKQSAQNMQKVKQDFLPTPLSFRRSPILFMTTTLFICRSNFHELQWAFQARSLILTST